METIRNYLETMFTSLPDTVEVRKARHELLQMMEDKYTELINEGKTDNEAVGIVISEFGNLDEIADDLGIKEVIVNQPDIEARKVSLEEVKTYLYDKNRFGLMIAIGVYLCITSVCGFFVCELLHLDNEIVGLIYLFLSIAVAVGLFVYSGMSMSKWDFLEKEPCTVDYATTSYVGELRDNNRSQRALMITIGVILCIASVLPVAVIDELFHRDSIFGVILMFVMVGIAVVLFVTSGQKHEGYTQILSLNEKGTIGSHFVRAQQKEAYCNETVATIMEFYWPTVTCLYLIWSFITFQWWMTWIIWPIAGIIHGVVKKVWAA